MRTKLIFTLSLLFSSHFCSAQLLLPQKGREPGFHPKFNPAFVSSHHIKEIRCETAVKPDGKKIKSTGDIEIFQFARDGRLEMVRKMGEAIADTGFTFYFIVADRLECEMKNDATGMLSYCYSYTENGYISEMKFGRTENFQRIEQAGNPHDLPLISTEKYAYREYENQVHGTLFNSAGRPYQKETWYYNENGYLEMYLKSYVMSSGREKEEYTYDEHGWLARKTVEIGKQTNTRAYVYDNVGNLMEEHFYDGDKFSYRKEYVYSPETFLIQAELSREEDLSQIRLINYSYVYW